jgi:hypothetical protein
MKKQYVLELQGNGYLQQFHCGFKFVTCLMVENAHKFDSVADAKATRTCILNSQGGVGLIQIHVYVPAKLIPATVKEYDERVDLIERLTVILECYPQKTDSYQTISDAILYLEGSYQ